VAARNEYSQGLYVDPSPPGDAASQQNKTVQGYVVVTYSHPSDGNTAFGTPATTTVTLNGDGKSNIDDSTREIRPCTRLASEFQLNWSPA
jgi:hypothetical protein